MRWLISMIMILLVAAIPLRAQDNASSGVELTITRQIEAFQADDLATAFSIASPGIQQMFGSPQKFGIMVQRGFPMVWRPSDYQFLALTQEAGQSVQRVLVTDTVGVKHVLEYRLSQTDGGWQINSVVILPAVEASV
jgi:hypothetical protein